MYVHVIYLQKVTFHNSLPPSLSPRAKIQELSQEIGTLTQEVDRYNQDNAAYLTYEKRHVVLCCAEQQLARGQALSSKETYHDDSLSVNSLGILWMVQHHLVIPQHHWVIPQRHWVIPQHHLVIPQRHWVIPQHHLVIPQRHWVVVYFSFAPSGPLTLPTHCMWLQLQATDRALSSLSLTPPRAEQLAGEIKELQGEMADYNTVSFQ